MIQNNERFNTSLKKKTVKMFIEEKVLLRAFIINVNNEYLSKNVKKYSWKEGRLLSLKSVLSQMYSKI